MAPHVESSAAAARRAKREADSTRRLEAVWAERDALLDGEEAMTENGKTYQCKVCQETFSDRFRLAGHVSNRHRKTGRRPAGEKANGRPANSSPPCPLCARPLPLGAGILVRAYTEEGLPEELAAKLAARAYGLLTVPG